MSDVATLKRFYKGQMEAMERARPLCPDHRDKQHGRECLACEVERLTNALRAIADCGSVGCQRCKHIATRAASPTPGGER